MACLGVCTCRAHDLHHRDLENNYGQYSMYWDRLLGSYKASK